MKAKTRALDIVGAIVLVCLVIACCVADSGKNDLDRDRETLDEILILLGVLLVAIILVGVR